MVTKQQSHFIKCRGENENESKLDRVTAQWSRGSPVFQPEHQDSEPVKGPAGRTHPRSPLLPEGTSSPFYDFWQKPPDHNCCNHRVQQCSLDQYTPPRSSHGRAGRSRSHPCTWILDISEYNTVHRGHLDSGCNCCFPSNKAKCKQMSIHLQRNIVELCYNRLSYSVYKLSYNVRQCTMDITY